MSSENRADGYLELILGPMFSGKTSKLIEVYKQCMFCNISVAECKIIHQYVWNNVLKMPSAPDAANKFNIISLQYGIEKRNMLRQFLNSVIRSHTTSITSDLLNRIEHIMHNQECKTEYVMHYISLVITKWAREMKLNDSSPIVI